MKVREVSCGKMHEFAIALDKAGFDSDLIQKIINSENNAMAKGMFLSVTEEKFFLIKDLGCMVVPEDFKSDNYINYFREKNLDSFVEFRIEINDTNFSKPSCVMNPGDKFLVSIFKQNVNKTTSAERITFLHSKRASLVGIHGLLLLFNQKRDLFVDKWYTSFDEEEKLFKHPISGGYQLPLISADSVNNKHHLYLQDFSDSWTELDYLVCFIKI